MREPSGLGVASTGPVVVASWAATASVGPAAALGASFDPAPSSSLDGADDCVQPDSTRDKPKQPRHRRRTTGQCITAPFPYRFGEPRQRFSVGELYAQPTGAVRRKD